MRTHSLELNLLFVNSIRGDGEGIFMSNHPCCVPVVDKKELRPFRNYDCITGFYLIDKNLSDRELRMLMVFNRLISYGQNGRYQISYPRLASLCSKSVRSVMEIIKSLCESGYLKAKSSSSKNKHQSNVYRLNVRMHIPVEDLLDDEELELEITDGLDSEYSEEICTGGSEEICTQKSKEEKIKELKRGEEEVPSEPIPPAKKSSGRFDEQAALLIEEWNNNATDKFQYDLNTGTMFKIGSFLSKMSKNGIDIWPNDIIQSVRNYWQVKNSKETWCDSTPCLLLSFFGLNGRKPQFEKFLPGNFLFDEYLSNKNGNKSTETEDERIERLVKEMEKDNGV